MIEYVINNVQSEGESIRQVIQREKQFEQASNKSAEEVLAVGMELDANREIFQDLLQKEKKLEEELQQKRKNHLFQLVLEQLD
jgi:hypothetical protein